MLRFLCIVCVLLWCSGVQADQQPIVTTDMLRIRTATSIDVSADGSRAVFAVRSIDTENSDDSTSYAYRSHLYVVDLRQREPRAMQITFGQRNDRSPDLSPDGRRIAFVRGGEGNERPQLWIMPVDGGEARQVTNKEHGISSPQWSPDGRAVLFTVSVPFDELDGQPDWPKERPLLSWADDEFDDDVTPRPDGTREEIRAWLANNAKGQNPYVINRIDFQDEQSLKGMMRFSHLYLVEVGNSNDHSEPRRITEGFFDHLEPAFMPDGSGIVYVANKNTEHHPDRVRTRDLWMIGLDGSNDRQLLTKEEWRFGSPKPSVDGSVIAFTGQKQDEPSFRQRQLGVLTMRRGEPTDWLWLTDEEVFDASVRSIQWQPSQAAIMFTTAKRGRFPLMMMSPGLIAPEPIVEEHHGMPVGVQRFAAGGGVVVYAMGSPQNPCVIRLRDASGDRLLMDLNDWTAEKKLSMPTEGWITRPDGTRVQYWLMEPTNRQPGETYPLVLQIHGGPHVMWGPGEASMWHEFQLLSSWGYGVVYANPRGSSGYGYAFQRGNFQNWGEGPAGDVLAATDQAMLQEWVDRDRLLITGGSYAGYLTAWIIAHDHRFKAAVAQRGVYHLPTFFGEGNAWRLVPRAMGGVPMESRFRQIIERESPFTYVNRIRTPLLIMHASEDLRTGVSQSEMMYRALKYLDRPVEFVRYPGAGHDLSRTGAPIQRLDRLNRIVEFFERHVENDRPAPILEE